MTPPSHSQAVLMSLPLPRAFYAQPTLTLARDLLGLTLWRRTDAGLCAGIIVETEAYISAIDPASHNYLRRSARSAVMFGPPGHAYIYLIYGMYHCLNIVAEPEGTSAAVLLRSLAPIAGLELMHARCPAARRATDLARGPGRLCRALGLTLAENGLALDGDALWLSITSPEHRLEGATIATSPRIGITRGADLPWRFYLQGHPAVSGPKAWRS